MTTTRATPSASGLAHALFCGGAAGFSGIAAVVATSSRAASGLPGVAAASRSASGALTVPGAASSTRGEEVQNQTAAITTAAPTLANIRPNALRIVTTSPKNHAAFSLGH